jgi:hypothetical protein
LTMNILIITFMAPAQFGHWARIILGYKKRHLLIFFVI